MHITTLNMTDSLSRLHKHFIGSDRFFQNTLENTGFPAYNIEKISDDSYKLTLAIAGFSKQDIEVKIDNNNLTITGSKNKTVERTYLYQGIAERGFQREFCLMDNTFVTGAEFKDGLLHISIKLELPEKLKPKTIEIN